MKNIFAIVFWFFCFMANAQTITPTWKFWIEFENGDGQKDTIAYIWDDSATGGVDSVFNEEGIEIDTSIFNVFIGNQDGNTTKTAALPFLAIAIQNEIFATKVVHPLIIRWDTTLLNSPQGIPGHPITKGILYNDYFFFENNTLSDHLYNMMIVDSAYCPDFNWGPQVHFPLSISIERVDFIGLDENANNPFKIYPNPVNDIVRINIDHIDFNAKLFDAFGKEITAYTKLTETNFDVSGLPCGIYFIQLFDCHTQKIYYHKLIKY